MLKNVFHKFLYGYIEYAAPMSDIFQVTNNNMNKLCTVNL